MFQRHAHHGSQLCYKASSRRQQTLLLNSFTRAGAVIRLGTCLVVCKYGGKERPPARVYSRLNVSTNETIVEKKKIKVRHFTASVLLWFTKGLPVPAKTYTMVNVILGWHDADLMYSLCTLQALLQFRLCKNAIFVGSLWVELRRRSLSQAGLRQLQQSAVLVANERLKESCFHKPSDKHVAKQSFIFFFLFKD